MAGQNELYQEKLEDMHEEDKVCKEEAEGTEQGNQSSAEGAEEAGENQDKPFQVRAKEKLEEELKKAKDKSFAEPVIGYLLKRCAEDEGLAEDVCQKHKTWEKCFNFIYESARKLAKGNNRCAVRDDVVYEWAEDYYHKDDKAEEERKAKEKAEAAKKKGKQNKTKSNKSFKDNSAKKSKAEPKEKVKREAVKPQIAQSEKSKKSNRDMEGQMDLFSLMGL